MVRGANERYSGDHHSDSLLLMLLVLLCADYIIVTAE